MTSEFAERNAIFYAGWLGHYVADASNPMHTTIQHNGWVGPNPNGYTTANTIHWKMEGIFVAANQKQLQFADLVPASPRLLADPFQDYLSYLWDSHQYVEKVYQLEKAGGFDGEGTPESREFIRQRLAAGAQMLRDMWYSAWIQSATDPPPYSPAKPASTPARPSPKSPMRSLRPNSECRLRWWPLLRLESVKVRLQLPLQACFLASVEKLLARSRWLSGPGLSAGAFLDRCECSSIAPQAGAADEGMLQAGAGHLS